MSLEPTLELDKQIAEILGHTVCDRAKAVEMTNRIVGGNPWNSWYANPFYLEDSLTKFGMDILPRYSLDLNAAFEAAEKFGLFRDRDSRKTHLLTQNMRDSDWGIYLWDQKWDRDAGEIDDLKFVAEASTPALAICEAILKLAKERQ